MERAILPVNNNNLLNSISVFDENLAIPAHDFDRWSGGEFSPNASTLEGKIVYVQVADKGSKRPEELYMRAMLLGDVAKQAGAEKVIMWTPELHYSRADKPEDDKPFSAKLLAEIIALRFDAVLTTHVHSPLVHQIYSEAFQKPAAEVLFDINPMYIYANHVLKNKELYGAYGKNLVVTIPDLGCLKDGNLFIGLLKNNGLTDLSWIQCSKHRKHANNAKYLEIKIKSTSENFNSVDGKKIVSIDDIGDTFGTQSRQAKKIIELGHPDSFISYLTHLILAGEADKRIQYYGFNVFGSNSHPNIEYRTGTWTKNVGVLDFTPVWYVGMKEAVEKNRSANSVLKEVWENGESDSLYKEIREINELKKLEIHNLKNGSI